MDQKDINEYQSREFGRSRTAYMLWCTFEYFVAICVSDIVLPYLLKEIGMPDSLIGITNSLISLSCLFQFFTVGLARRVKNPKRFSGLIHCLGQLFFMCIYLIPFLPCAAEYKHILVIVCLLVAYLGNYLVKNIIYKWAHTYVAPSKRARFGATKEIISLLSGIVVSFVIGFVVDVFQKAENPNGAFIFLAIGIFVFIVCDLTCLMLIKNNTSSSRAEEEEKTTMGEVLSNTLGNKSYRNVILLSVLWSCGIYTSIVFLGTYRLNELAFSMTAVQTFSIAGSLIRAAISYPIGRYVDRTSYSKGVQIGLLFAGVAVGLNMFTTPETRILMLFSTVLYSAAYAGLNVPIVNMAYSYVEKKYLVQALALREGIGGVCGFLASLGAGKLLDMIQSNGNMIFGIHVYGQQVLSFISFLFIVAAILLTKLVIEKQRVIEKIEKEPKNEPSK